MKTFATLALIALILVAPSAQSGTPISADDTLKGKRDRAILSVLLFHAFRREELCKLKVKDITEGAGAVAVNRAVS